MDLLKGVFSAPLLLVIFFVSGSYSSQLYLQPHSLHHGYFTGDQFFITCFTTDESIDQLKWTDSESNAIEATDGRIHVQAADGDQQGLRLVFTSVDKDDSGKYTCSDDQDSITFDLIVSRSIGFGDTPKVQHAPEKENGIILCHVRSDAHPVVTWYHKGKQIKNGEKYKILENHSLRIMNLSRSDAGNYKCKALLITSLSTQVKDLDVEFHVQYPPEIIGDQRKKHYAEIGTRVTMPCNVTADPEPMFEWLRDEMIIHNGTKGYLMHNAGNTSTLELNFEGEEQLGEYICRASNALGEEEVILELKEGGPPAPPKLVVRGEDKGILKLSLEAHKDPDLDEELKTTGFKVEYILATDKWDEAEFQEFKIGEPYLLTNMSFNSEYLLRVAGHNLAGYGQFSEPMPYKTQSLQVAPVISSSAGMLMASTLVLFTSIVFFRLF